MAETTRKKRAKAKPKAKPKSQQKSRRNTLTHKPTRALRKKVQQMAVVGVKQEDIAKALAITRPTLLKHYREELDNARLMLNSEVGGFLFEQCKKGNTTAIIWWEKTRGGLRESGKPDNPSDNDQSDLLKKIADALPD